MDAAAQALRGEHDFTSFRAGACQARHPVREIHDISVSRAGDVVALEVTANAFLYHMVRNIAGSLLLVGLGEAGLAWMGELLALRDRSRAAPTAAPEGLYFVSARYPDHYGLPAETPAFPRGRDLS
jgi:tRNA pseudouridine38-40 synthase